MAGIGRREGEGVGVWCGGMETTGNPLALEPADGFVEDVGPDLEPTGKTPTGAIRENWMEERDSFQAYLASRGIGGLSDTAGSRMQRKQVRTMEKMLGAEGADGRAALDKVLRDPASSAIVEAWREEEDKDYGCPGSLALMPNLICVTLLVGLFLFASFKAAYDSTPRISDQELEKQAIMTYREKMAAGQRAYDGMEPEPEPEPVEAEAHIDAQIFLAASVFFFLLGLVTLASSSGGDEAEEAPAARAAPVQPTVPAQPAASQPAVMFLQQRQAAVGQPQVTLPAQSDRDLEHQKLDLLFAKKVGGSQPEPQPEPAGDEDADFC